MYILAEIFVHRLCTFKQNIAHTLCTFKQKFVRLRPTNHKADSVESIVSQGQKTSGIYFD